MTTIAFFNNKGGVGKTSLVYHLSWKLQELGHRVLVSDLDPQSNLTSMFLDDDQIETLWSTTSPGTSMLNCVDDLNNHLGDIKPAAPIAIADGLYLVPGSLALGQFEDRLANAWNDSRSDKPTTRADGLRVMSAFHRVLAQASGTLHADLTLIDVGPSIGALNRAALITADMVVIPLAADLFSLQGLRNLGPTLRDWRSGWQRRLEPDLPPAAIPLPSGTMTPLGYVLLNPSVRESYPVKSYLKWAAKIPASYARDILNAEPTTPEITTDPNQLAMIRHFKSLMPMAQEARKPMFQLTARDGAIGGHAGAVRDADLQFTALAQKLLHLASTSASPIA